MPAPPPDARPAFTRNYSGSEVQFGALDRLAARIASIEPKGSLFLTGWTLSMPVLALAMIGFGYFKGMYDANIRASLHDVVKPERRATTVGVMNTIG